MTPFKGRPCPQKQFQDYLPKPVLLDSGAQKQIGLMNSGNKMDKTIVNDSNILQVFYDQFNQPIHLQPGESKIIDIEDPVEQITITAGAKRVLISGVGKNQLTLLIDQKGE